MARAWPPSHRSIDDPQIEVCEHCGLWVGARHLARATAQGMRGFMVCDVTPACRDMRHRMSYSDRRRLSRRSSFVGQSRLWEPGDTPWWTDRPSDDLFTPFALSSIKLWMRQDDIPFTTKASQWGTVGNIGLPQATNSTTATQPDVLANPFSSGYRGLEFGGTEFLQFPSTITTTVFTYSVALRTPATLAETYLVRNSSASTGVKLMADGSIRVLFSSDVIAIAGAGTISASTNYILSFIKDSDGELVARRNGAQVGGPILVGPAAFDLDRVGDGAGMMAVTVAEEMLYGADHTDNISDLERYLSYLVGVTL